MTNPLQQIPLGVRRGLYLAYALVGVVLGALAVADVNTIGSVEVSTINDVFVYVGTALGLTAASNAFETNTATVAAPGSVTVLPDARNKEVE